MMRVSKSDLAVLAVTFVASVVFTTVVAVTGVGDHGGAVLFSLAFAGCGWVAFGYCVYDLVQTVEGWHRDGRIYSRYVVVHGTGVRVDVEHRAGTKSYWVTILHGADDPFTGDYEYEVKWEYKDHGNLLDVLFDAMDQASASVYYGDSEPF
jgi:hypothetical protein